MYSLKPPRYYEAEIISHFQGTNLRLTIVEFGQQWSPAAIQRFGIQPGRDGKIGWPEVSHLEARALASLSLIP